MKAVTRSSRRYAGTHSRYIGANLSLLSPIFQRAQSLLKDDRFNTLFTNPDFQVDQHAEEYRLLNPVVSKMDKARQKELQRQELIAQQFEEVGVSIRSVISS